MYLLCFGPEHQNYVLLIRVIGLVLLSSGKWTKKLDRLQSSEDKGTNEFYLQLYSDRLRWSSSEPWVTAGLGCPTGKTTTCHGRLLLRLSESFVSTSPEYCSSLKVESRAGSVKYASRILDKRWRRRPDKWSPIRLWRILRSRYLRKDKKLSISIGNISSNGVRPERPLLLLCNW